MLENAQQAVFISLVILAAGAGIWFITRPPHAGPDAASKIDKVGEAAPRLPKRTGDPPPTGDEIAAPKGTQLPAPDPDAGREALLKELEDKVVVNLGTVEGIGEQFADLLLTRKEKLELESIAAGDRSAEQSSRLLDLQRQSAATLGILPEITSFQDDPDEYARFFGSLLKEAAGLDEPAAAAASNYMRGRGEAMVAAKLNAANEPDDRESEEAWEEQRDAFNEATAAGIAQLLAPGEAERIGFTPGFLELLEQDFDKAD